MIYNGIKISVFTPICTFEALHLQICFCIKQPLLVKYNKWIAISSHLNMFYTRLSIFLALKVPTAIQLIWFCKCF